MHAPQHGNKSLRLYCCQSFVLEGRTVLDSWLVLCFTDRQLFLEVTKSSLLTTLGFFLSHLIFKKYYFMTILVCNSILQTSAECLLCAEDCCLCAMESESRAWLCDPMDCSPPGSSVHGVLQARRLGCLAIVSSSRVSSQPREQTHISGISCIVRKIVCHCATWETPVQSYKITKVV